MRKTNEAGRKIIKEYEGLELKAYQDSVGIWTIGYGHTSGVKRGDVITQSQAEQFLIDDLAYAEGIVEKAVVVPLTDNQFAALVSFVFNVGPGKKGVKDGFVTLKSGKQSSMLRLLNEQKYAVAAEQFMYWNKAGGKALLGLTRRRTAERKLFLTP